MTSPARAPSTLSIGQLAQLTGVPAKTIRYYEEIELLSAPRRAGNGYRRYTEDDAHLLHFIKRARDLGFSVEQVRELTELWTRRDRASRQVRELAQAHLEEIESKLRQLEALRKTLASLIADCHGDDRPECPILEDLASHESSRA